jgi:hypothetical protein
MSRPACWVLSLYYRSRLLLFDGDLFLWDSQLNVTFCADELNGEENLIFSIVAVNLPAVERMHVLLRVHTVEASASAVQLCR